MHRYQIAHQTLRTDDPCLAEMLAHAHAAKLRPSCLCRNPGVAMYIAKVHGSFMVKRMPNSGADHAPVCDSYDPPPELSGLGDLVGSAIQENPAEGMTTLKLNFSLAKAPGRAPPTSDGVEHDTVKTDGNKLTLRGLLHFLWGEAGFNRWSPAMEGKRSWYVVRKYLLQATENKTTKGLPLASILYLPESFSVEQADQIEQRRIDTCAAAVAHDKGPRRLMLVVGEVKEIVPSRYGHKLVLKHLATHPLMLHDDLYARLCKRFALELELWDALEDSHLVMIATFGLGSTGISHVEELALMNVDDNWIPFENGFEKELVTRMTRAKRRFIKSLRYNLPSTRPLACAVALDALPTPVAMYVIPPGAGAEYQTALQALQSESNLPSWVWNVGSTSVPALPG